MKETSGILDLADGITWEILAGDGAASVIVSRLIEVMQLKPHGGSSRQLMVLTAESPEQEAVVSLPNQGIAFHIANPGENADLLTIGLMRIASLIGLDAMDRGGVLLHGALAETGGHGVILAGSGGAGKTTASNRLPYPWQSLCDDMTLVVRDKGGTYRAHPWPTWSKFMFGGQGGTWDVHHAVPLKGVFFLVQDQEGRVALTDSADGAYMLFQSAEQASYPKPVITGKEEERKVRLKRFDNACNLAQSVPCHLLHLNLTNAFWHDIAEALTQYTSGTAGRLEQLMLCPQVKS